MEITKYINMKKITFYILLLCVFTNCTKDSYETPEPTYYDFYYPSDKATITAKQIGDGTGTLDPKGIAVANDKLYICNGDVLEIFNAKTLAYIKSIKNYTKGTTTIALTRLSSVCIDNGCIYVGSIDSRIFIFDEVTNAGINTIGSGNWWDTFVHVFGITIKDGLLFVKEKETTIKVLETSKITETSNWNLAPFAKLNTLKGWTEIYSMDVISGNLVVAGRDTKSYLYYNIEDIRKNAAASLITPLSPTITAPNPNANPIAVSFGTDWAVTTESSGSANYIRLYPKDEFGNKTYNAQLSFTDVMGANPFGSIVGAVQVDDTLFLSDNTNKCIRVVKLNKSQIGEQQ